MKALSLRPFPFSLPLVVALALLVAERALAEEPPAVAAPAESPAAESPAAGSAAAESAAAESAAAESPTAKPSEPAAPALECKRNQRGVRRGTPVLGGPGLGFEILTVVEKDGCLPSLEASADGSFALVVLEEGKKLGWVATGLVDKRLSAASTAPTPLPAEGKVRPVRTVVLRDAPRFDALAVAMPLVKDVELTVKGLSPDGQWLLLEAPAGAAAAIGEAPDGGAALVGWVPKYQVAEKPPEAGGKPSAGSGGWAETRGGRRPYQDTAGAKAAAAPPPGDVAGGQATKDGPAGKPAEAKPSGGEPGGGKTVEGKPVEGKTVEGKPVEGKPVEGKTVEGKPVEGKTVEAPAPAAVVAAPVLGRTQEVSVHVGYRYWQESYLSDAAVDAFYKYDWIAPAALHFGGGYGYRGSFPLVVEVNGAIAVGGWLHPDLVQDVDGRWVPNPAPDQQPTPLVSAQVHTWSRVAWRLFDTANVDVDAGGALTLDALLNYNLTSKTPAPPSIVVNGFYGGVGPSLVARSRLGENGRFGLLVIEAQLPLGGYAMFPDPGMAYNALPAGKQIYPPAVAGGNMTEPGTTPPVVQPLDASPLPLHLAVGIDGRLRYQYAFTNLLRAEVSTGVIIRQASIAGPGLRTGQYSKATNVDVLANLSVGMTFGF